MGREGDNGRGGIVGRGAAFTYIWLICSGNYLQMATLFDS